VHRLPHGLVRLQQRLRELGFDRRDGVQQRVGCGIGHGLGAGADHRGSSAVMQVGGREAGEAGDTRHVSLLEQHRVRDDRLRRIDHRVLRFESCRSIGRSGRRVNRLR